MADKIRIRRKDLKKPDGFVETTGHALTWLRENTTFVLWIAGAGLAVLVAIGVTTAYRAARTRDANTDLARAMATSRQTGTADGTAALHDVAQRWEGTSIAPVAALLAANALVRSADFGGAVRALEQLHPQSTELPRYLRQQLLATWGAALEGEGAWADAAAKYEAAAALGGPYTPRALLGEARARTHTGESKRAAELYRKVHEQYPELPERRLIAARVDL